MNFNKTEFYDKNCIDKDLVRESRLIWSFFNDYCTETNHFLPPDNIEINEKVITDYRTSPTDIGLMLLCVLAARDYGFITTNEMCVKISNSLNTIKQLGKWNGNLYNWYDINTLKPMYPEFVSSIDSGNFVCSIVSVAQGLLEYQNENAGITAIVNEINKIISETNLSIFYNRKKSLFCTGYYSLINKYSDSFYDQFMCEGRLLSYYAIASGITEKNHWNMLNRTIGTIKDTMGYKSWYGSTFECFMPQIFLPTFDNSETSHSLQYCLKTQKITAEELNLPYGISESGYGDRHENGRYKYEAHGVPLFALSQNVVPTIISPYSTFLTLSFDKKNAVQNLEEIKKYNAYGRYGYYEAIDFCIHDKPVLVKSYMAHHLAMSMLSILNVTHDNLIQKRFMSFPRMQDKIDLLMNLMEVSQTNNVNSYKIEAILNQNDTSLLTDCLLLISIIVPKSKAALNDIISKYRTRFKDLNVGFSLNYLDSHIEMSEREKEVYDYCSSLDFIWIRKRRYDKKNRIWGVPNKKYGGIEYVINSLRSSRKYKYVMLLDSDTYIDRESIKQMMAFAKNNPQFNIYSPRIEQINKKYDCEYLNWLNENGYKYLSAGDMLCDNLFYGKGLISIDRFHMISEYFKSPILSHDIIESGLNNCIKLNNIVAYEETPKSVKQYMSRLERWMRGDFQNFPYIFSDHLSSNCKAVIKNNILMYLSVFPVSKDKNAWKFKLSVFKLVLRTIPKTICRTITKRNLLEWTVYQ